MALPKLSAQQRITNPDGTPSSPFLQFMERARSEQIATDEAQAALIAGLAAAIVDIQAALDAAAVADAKAVVADDKAVAAQADADSALTLASDAVADAADALLAVDDVVDGTTPFTALNVGGVNVKPFLDNTDGTKIDTAAALGTAVVATAAVQAQGVSNAVSAFTNTAQSLTTTEQNCQGVTYTTTGERLEIFFSFYLNVFHPAGGGIDTMLRLYRQGTLIWDFTVSATGDDFAFGWQSVVVPDQPAAGSYLYQLTVQLSAATAASATASSRFLRVTELKR